MEFQYQRAFAHDLGFMLGYFGTKGTDLNVERNYNQITNRLRPYPTLSLKSPIAAAGSRRCL